MNTNFSKYWHFFYCAVIGALGYLYYNAAFGQEQFDNIFETRKALRMSNELFDNQNQNLLTEIQKTIQAKGDTCNRIYLDASIKYTENSKILCDYLNDVKDELIENTGGIDARYTDGRMVNCKSYFPYFSFFNKKKKKEIQGAFDKYKANRYLIISNLDKDVSIYFGHNTIIEDSTFWDRLANSSPANALLKLEELIHNVKQDELQVLYHSDNKAKADCIYCGMPNLVLLTEQINVENQDYFEGYVSLMDNAFICKSRDIAFFANGKNLPCNIDERGAYLKYKPTKQGKNKINLECRVKNPLTDEWKTVKSKVYFYSK